MWYFSWILGLGLALCFGILNAIWYEILESQRETPPRVTGSSAVTDRQPPA
jgi:cyd operon protein YbgT